MRVIVTRPAAEAAEWVEVLQGHGFDAVSLPLIEVRAVNDAASLRSAWQRIGEYRAVMFVSANAVRAFFAARPEGAQADIRAWATGAGTRAALAAAGVRGIDSPPDESAQFDSEALWQVVGTQCANGDRVLIVRGTEAGSQTATGRDWLAQRLAACGAHVDQLAAYVRACPAFAPHELALASTAANDGSVWLFSSSQAIVNLRARLPGTDWSKTRAVATHPRIARAARDAGFGVVCVSRPPMAEVIAALESLG
jgi:uroporphyrinogen-III synthase